MTTLIVATRNAHKVQEIQEIFSGAFHFLTLNDFPEGPDAIEDADSFAGNAKKKSISLAQWLLKNPQLLMQKSDPAKNEIFVLADDSGLEVDFLNGAPGIYSARFAALDSAQPGNSPDSSNNAKLLRLLENVPDEKRSARFRCVLALTQIALSPATSLEDSTTIFDGACEGRIARNSSGKAGFGYDPLFIPAGQTVTFAELGPSVKNRLSHRAKALAKLKYFLSV